MMVSATGTGLLYDM